MFNDIQETRFSGVKRHG